MKKIIKILTEKQKQTERRNNLYKRRIHILKRFLKLQNSTSFNQYNSYEYRTIKYLREKLREIYGSLDELIFILAYLRNNHPIKYSHTHNTFHYEETIKQLAKDRSLKMMTFLSLRSCENFHFLDEVITRFNYEPEIYRVIKNVITNYEWDWPDVRIKFVKPNFN